MLTKKEKLLIYPWQLKRFNQHRKKVENAEPAIDFDPPNEYPHITLKLKKFQKESERQEKVNRDNIRLLQRLGSIMTTKRLNNFWVSPRPNFLNREFIPHLTTRDSLSASSSEMSSFDDDKIMQQSKSGKSYCAICSGKSLKTNKIIPEVRIPWKPAQPTRNVKLLREADIKRHKCCKFCC
jgi:hypothetical protein